MRRRDLNWNNRAGYGYGYSSMFYGLGGGQNGASYLSSGRAQRGPVSRRFPSDETLELEVAEVIDRMSEIDSTAVRVSVRDRCVSLDGVIPSHDVLEQLTEAILALDDIEKVETDDIVILPFNTDQVAG